ncbi:MAG: hypothetical protein IJV17_05120 [Prevotella sp.]|nr:hypothetical protein [Prevotella sp.]
MKKIFLLSLVLLTTLSFYSCKDDDDKGSTDNSERLFRPMFRTYDNTGKSTDPYLCAIEDYNNIHMYWYLVDDAVAYEIKWAMFSYISGGAEAWAECETGENGKSLTGDVVISDPTKFDLLLKDRPYNVKYGFAIRALNSFDATGLSLYENEPGVYDVLGKSASWKEDPKNSEWNGYGTLRQWADYYAMETQGRTWVPFVIQVSDITKTSMKLTLNRSIASYKDDVKATYREHWNFVDADENLLKIDYLTVTPSSASPNAQVDPQFAHYPIPESAWDENGICIIELTGLSENSIYNIDVWDESITVPVDACYNSQLKRTKGDPAAPKLIEHVPTAVDTVGGNPYDISAYNSMKLDNILNDYIASNTEAENQVFYLEGGKTYHVSTNISIYKGFTLRTNPDDLAQGKRAKFLLSGMTKTGANVNTCNFMIGRTPNAGENSSIPIDVDSVRFMDLDVEVPQAGNFGTSQDGTANASGNYFMNMYSNGMGINVTLLEWNNCTFQGLVRGFFRIQGSNDFNIHKIVMKDCVHYNCGFFANNGGGYCYIYADHNGKPKSSILEDLEISGCVFYDSPKGNLVTDANRNITWDSEIKWNVNVHHNTFVNFCTRANTAIINTRYNPGGSYLAFHDNVVILTRDEADVNRNMGSAGWDTRNVQGGDGSGRVTFDIYNNWTTNDPYLTNGQPFKSQPFNGTSNAPAKWLKTWGEDYFPGGGLGSAELQVHLDDLKATDLMVAPNPQHFVGEKASGLDHHTDTGIDGLYYKQTDAVLNSDIYKSGAGAPMLRNGK